MGSESPLVFLWRSGRFTLDGYGHTKIQLLLYLPIPFRMRLKIYTNHNPKDVDQVSLMLVS